jgi:talin
LHQQDIPQIGAAVTTITSNLPELSKDIKIIAALMNDNERGNDLIDAARRLCKALDEMLKGIGPDSQIPRFDVLKSASKIGETSQQILADLCNTQEFDKETYDILLKIARGVATASATLVMKAKDIAQQLEEQYPEAKNRIISSALQVR